MSLDDRNSLQVGLLDKSEMLMSDYLGRATHNNYGTPGWNVTKVDGSTKFNKSNAAAAYVKTNNVWSNWAANDNVRAMLID